MVRLRQVLPPYFLTDAQGRRVYLPDLKGRPLALVRDSGLALELSESRALWEVLPAQAYLLAKAPISTPLPLLLDPAGNLVESIPKGGALVTDAHLEVYHLGPVQDAREVVEWLAFVTHQCPECVLPEQDWV
ncbi:MAG: hypothetical protein C4298_08720 [Thermus sp.]|uniref:hypothetical protein n=1 Tax=Thermus sp. TaxID=275 RepID=UPI0033212C03